MNSLAQDDAKVSNYYSWNFTLNIKQAGKIKRLSSINHEIDYSLSEDGTLAQVKLKKGEETNLGKDFILYFQNDKMFEPIGFTQINEFGEQSFLVNFLPIVKPPKIKENYFLKLNKGNEGAQIDTIRQIKYKELAACE